jgi:sulfoxide reductase catalytic subunit YedY
MLITRLPDVRSSEITDRTLYVNRREFIRAAAGTVALAATAARTSAQGRVAPAPHGRKLEPVAKSPLSTTEKANSWNEITTYNNFYEFGSDKDDPARLAARLKTEPWSVVVDGECNKKGTYTIDDVLKGETLEERIYRHRCVEGWSMVIPWVGFPVANFIKRCEPSGKAKYVEFTTLADSSQMPGVRFPVLRWPYVEGLRIDEAMHPLAILAVGLYGEVMPKQDGAPIRLVVPWKYGFKSIKSIVKIRFAENQPATSWQISAPEYYAFYSNVNPGRTGSTFRDQRTERRIGEFFMRKTQMFNGYGDQVARLYSGMDLGRNY